jgi:hypothetical protein
MEINNAPANCWIGLYADLEFDPENEAILAGRTPELTREHSPTG